MLEGCQAPTPSCAFPLAGELQLFGIHVSSACSQYAFKCSLSLSLRASHTPLPAALQNCTGHTTVGRSVEVVAVGMHSRLPNLQVVQKCATHGTTLASQYHCILRKCVESMVVHQAYVHSRAGTVWLWDQMKFSASSLSVACLSMDLTLESQQHGKCSQRVAVGMFAGRRRQGISSSPQIWRPGSPRPEARARRT